MYNNWEEVFAALSAAKPFIDEILESRNVLVGPEESPLRVAHSENKRIMDLRAAFDNMFNWAAERAGQESVGRAAWENYKTNVEPRLIAREAELRQTIEHARTDGKLDAKMEKALKEADKRETLEKRITDIERVLDTLTLSAV